jgi:hypothetical protein
MKALLLILALTPAAYANFPVKQSQTWQVSPEKIYVSDQNASWEIDHTCDNYNLEGASVSIVFDERTKFGITQSRVRKNAHFQMSVNGETKMCRVEQVTYLK